MLIKKANCSDIARLSSLQVSIFDYEPPYTPEEWEDIILNDTVFCALEPDGSLAGAIIALNDPSGDLKLDQIFVDSSRQGRGIGQHLMNSFIDLQNSLSKTAFLRVAPDNKTAISLYKNNGFVATTGVIEKYLSPDALQIYRKFGIAHTHSSIMTRSPQSPD